MWYGSQRSCGQLLLFWVEMWWKPQTWLLGKWIGGKWGNSVHQQSIVSCHLSDVFSYKSEVLPFFLICGLSKTCLHQSSGFMYGFRKLFAFVERILCMSYNSHTSLCKQSVPFQNITIDKSLFFFLFNKMDFKDPG